MSSPLLPRHSEFAFEHALPHLNRLHSCLLSLSFCPFTFPCPFCFQFARCSAGHSLDGFARSTKTMKDTLASKGPVTGLNFQMSTTSKTHCIGFCSTSIPYLRHSSDFPTVCTDQNRRDPPRLYLRTAVHAITAEVSTDARSPSPRWFWDSGINGSSREFFRNPQEACSGSQNFIPSRLKLYDEG